jgi:thiamine biosynthesis lipoprotein
MTRREVLRITAVVGVGAAISVAAVRDLIKRATLQRVSVTRTQLGTAVTVTVMHPDAVQGRALVDAAFAEIERLEGILSRYRATSAVAALNRDGIVRAAPVELTEVVARSLEYSRLTDGAFDVTVAPVLNLYVSRFAAETLPSDTEVDAAHALVGWRDLHVDGSTIALARPGMAITLDAIAKGFVVDRGVAALVERGAERILVQASGDMHAAGADDEPWAVAIQNPHDMQGTLGVVALRGSIASSGDYMQAFTPDRSLHHIIDPRTGRSPLRASGTTVLAPTAMDADAASTSAFVLGPEAGVAFLDRLDGVEGVVVDKAGTRFMSKGFGRELA